MSIKKTNNISEADIQEKAARYYDLKTIIDNKTKEAKALAEELKKYAEAHPRKFDGNTFRIDDHVRIERRSSLKCEYDKERLTETWVIEFLDNGGAELMDVKFVAEAVNAVSNEKLAAMLENLGMKVFKEETLVVYKQK